MGCSQSKIDEEEAVIRCKDRKKFMKDAVVARNAFAAAHSAYAMSLKNTGAALSDYAQGEVQNPTQLGHASSASASVGGPQPPFVVVDSLPPPPPPPESDSGYTPVPLQRAQSMPEIKMPPKSKQSETMSSTIVEEDEEGEEMEGSEGLVRRKPRDRRAGGSSRGGGGSRREVVEERAPPPAATAASQWHDSAFADFIFPPEGSVPGTSLGEVEELRMEKEEIERKMYEERKLYDEEPKKVEEEVEKREEVVVEEKVPPVEAEKVAEKEKAVVGAGKGVKKAGKVGAGVGEKRAAKGGVNLVQIFADLDDHFLKASESAHDVSKMLEATRLHYHSNFADNRGHINHSERVMRVITWNRSFRGVSNPDDGKDDFDSEEHETHATVLDKLLAWEKKLYDEVKAGELMKIEYQRKVATLNKLKKRGTNSEALEKAKATVSQLHTRYIVDMQSMDSTVSEINRLRDKQLHPKLVQLVNAMATMWDTMRVHNESQSRIITDLRGLDLSQSPKETSDHHHDRTEQLWNVVRDWHMQFCKLVDFQREYIKSLSNWLKLNLIPIESSLKEKVSSPQRIENPPIQRLLIAWQDNLQKLRDEDARTAINNFAAVIETIMHHQADELRLREKCEESRRELSKKKRQFEDWYNKYMQRRTPDETDLDHASDQGNNEAVVERQMVVEMVKKRLEEEEEAYQRLCIQVREKSLASLKSRLPELFRAMSEVSSACAHMYSVLRSVSQPKN